MKARVKVDTELLWQDAFFLSRLKLNHAEKGRGRIVCLSPTMELKNTESVWSSYTISLLNFNVKCVTDIYISFDSKMYVTVSSNENKWNNP